MKKIGLLTTLLVAGLLLTGCFQKVQDCLSGDAACTREINIEEPEEDIRFPDSNVIYGGNGYHEIVGDKTIYYNSGCGISFRLREGYSGGIIKEEDLPGASYTDHIIIVGVKDDNATGDETWMAGYRKSLSIGAVSEAFYEEYRDAPEMKDLRIGHNNKYYFVREMVDKDAPYIVGELTDLHIFDVEEPIDEIPDDFDECKRYFDGCNRCTLQDDGERICTEEACEEYEEAYCADEQYDEFLEDIRSNIPLCNDIDLNLNTKYTYIDNVVENCTYEEGTAYSWNDGGCGGVMPHLYITKDIIGYFDIVADEDHPIICKSPRAGIIKSLSGHFEDLATFWYKHGITKKALIDTLEARTDEEVFRNECGYYFCNGDICEQFYRPSYGENDNHYYIYGYRYPLNGPYETVLLVDDKLYMLGQSENMFDEDYRPNPVKQGRWVVYGLDGDKLIVKRYVDGELIPPYTLENFNSYNFDEPTTTTKFKVKTCEIPL